MKISIQTMFWSETILSLAGNRILSKFCSYYVKLIVSLKCAGRDGHWGEWGPYSACDKNCGGGTQTRERECDNPAPLGSGKQCEGDKTESKPCNTQVSFNHRGDLSTYM